MKESVVESRLRDQVKKQLGGLAIKLVSPGFAGVPDRLVLLPGGRVVFVETKAPGKKPRALQQHCHKLLRELGFRVLVIDTPAGVDTFIKLERGVSGGYPL